MIYGGTLGGAMVLVVSVGGSNVGGTLGVKYDGCIRVRAVAVGTFGGAIAGITVG